MPQLARAMILTLTTLPRSHRLLLAWLLLITLVISFWRPAPVSHVFHRESSPAEIAPQLLPQASEPVDVPALEDITDPDDKTTPSGLQEYTVSKGDSLSSILTQYGVDNADVNRLSQADRQLRNLKIGQQLTWTVNADGELQQLNWHLSRRETRHYQREGQRFTVQDHVKSGQWQNQLLKGKVNGSFANSARQIGLTSAETSAIVAALQWQMDFRKLQKEDEFAVLLAREMLEGKREQSQLLAVRLNTGGKDYYAMLADDGKYYDRNGNGLAKGFLRFPTARQYPVSSAFNPRRLHPITGKIAPHKGVDFAMPVGTPILAVSDGEVIEAKNNPTAGRYLTIRHGRTYTTRYLHLQKILVKPGQKVKRGERIALSGNTGRSTGAHLHYELWINQQPVNPLTASLPRTEALVGKARAEYLAQVKVYSEQLRLD